jgi:hypothetical protein
MLEKELVVYRNGDLFDMYNMGTVKYCFVLSVVQFRDAYAYVGPTLTFRNLFFNTLYCAVRQVTSMWFFS